MGPMFDASRKTTVLVPFIQYFASKRNQNNNDNSQEAICTVKRVKLLLTGNEKCDRVFYRWEDRQC